MITSPTGRAQDADDQTGDAAGAAAEQPLDQWNTGHLKIGDVWKSVDEAVKEAQSDKSLEQYETRRERSKPTVASQTSLARWCERNGLPGQALAHWTVALRLDNNNRAARKALGVTRIRGEWLTEEDAELANAEHERNTERSEVFAAEIDQLKALLTSGEEAQVRTALDRIEEHTDAIEVYLLTRGLSRLEASADVRADVDKRLLDSASQFDERWAVEFTAAKALYADDESVRDRAVETLRLRDITEYAPLLLAQLQMPTELAVQVTQDGRGNVVSHFDEYREGPAGNDYERSYSYRQRTRARYRSAPVYDTRLVRPGYTVPERTIPARTIPARVIPDRSYSCGSVTVHQRGRTIPARTIPARTIPAREYPPTYSSRYLGTAIGSDYTPDSTRRINRAKEVAYRQATSKKYQTDRRNAYLNERNARIAKLLADATEEEVPEYPRELWQWWQQKWDKSPEMRERDRESVRRGLVHRLPAGVAGGTMIETRTGPRPISDLKIGDEVLAKSPVTGELAFKPVLAIAASDGHSLPQLRVGYGLLAIASGQKIWSVGEGWRLPQDLHEGALLYGLVGNGELEDQQQGVADHVFTLVVADFHTFFAGGGKTLLHDATTPLPVDATLPGWAPSSTETSAQVAAIKN